MSDTIQVESPREYPVEKKVTMWKIQLRGMKRIVVDDDHLVGLARNTLFTASMRDRYYIRCERLSVNWRPYGEYWRPYKDAPFAYQAWRVRQILDIMRDLSFDHDTLVFVPRSGFHGPLLIYCGDNIGFVAPRTRDDRKILHRRTKPKRRKVKHQ